jgi:UDP-N-acetylglucosamine--dolichyl-phosphate N-acetylglucosaminephosphotransferase
MTDYVLSISFFASFFLTLFLVPYWMRKAQEINLVWSDMNKDSEKKVSGSGGIMVMLGFVLGVLLYIAYRVFYLGSKNNFMVELFALLTVILMLSGIGFIDDLLGWRKGGLSRRSRMILVLMATIPLIVINAGKSYISLPFSGVIELGLIYPLILIPIGILGATTTFNFLAGFNGLEAGQGIILLSALSIVAYFTGNTWLTVISLCMVFSLLAFLVYNFYPAKVFPGDSLTYGVGGLIAIVSILGNFEKIALFFFIPYMIETGLKIRGKLVKQSFGMPKDGGLGLRYSKIYSLNHLAIHLIEKSGRKATELKAVLMIWTFQLIIVILGFAIFSDGVFG